MGKYREIEVLVWIAEGLSTKDIGRKLGVTFKTVASHRTHIMDKLDIHTAVELLRYAIVQKLIEP